MSIKSQAIRLKGKQKTCLFKKKLSYCSMMVGSIVVGVQQWWRIWCITHKLLLLSFLLCSYYSFMPKGVFKHKKEKSFKWFVINSYCVGKSFSTICSSWTNYVFGCKFVCQMYGFIKITWKTHFFSVNCVFRAKYQPLVLGFFFPPQKDSTLF